MCVTLELPLCIVMSCTIYNGVRVRVTCVCAANGARSAAVAEHHYMDSSVLSVVSVC